MGEHLRIRTILYAALTFQLGDNLMSNKTRQFIINGLIMLVAGVGLYYIIRR
jgi:uncharacterized protein YjeT (DUF2065 family)